MRMLVPGRPVKEVPATPPPVPAERPAYREKFIPPELSMWDYFVAKPFLPLSDSGALYDSDESGEEDDDDDDDDAFLSDTQMTEHSDPNSYSWSLIRLVMVKLALHNVKTFLPLTGLDFTGTQTHTHTRVDWQETVYRDLPIKTTPFPGLKTFEKPVNDNKFFI
nr:dmX-like protein 2 [Oncorhynchus nerka]